MVSYALSVSAVLKKSCIKNIANRELALHGLLMRKYFPKEIAGDVYKALFPLAVCTYQPIVLSPIN